MFLAKLVFASAALVEVNASFRGSVDPYVSKQGVGAIGTVSASHELKDGNTLRYGVTGMITTHSGPSFVGAGASISGNVQSVGVNVNPNGFSVGWNASF